MALEMKLYEMMNKRMDRHTEQLTEIGDKLFRKSDHIQDLIIKNREEFMNEILTLKERVAKLEDRNSLLRNALHYLFAAVAGFVASLLGKNH